MKEKRNIGNNWNSDVAIYIVDLHHLEAIIILIFPQVNINFTEFFIIIFLMTISFFNFTEFSFLYTYVFHITFFKFQPRRPSC